MLRRLIGGRRPEGRAAWPPALHRSLRWTLDAIAAGPALVQNSRLDVLAVNQLARAFYADLYACPANRENQARFGFLGPGSPSEERLRLLASWAATHTPGDQCAGSGVAVKTCPGS